MKPAILGGTRVFEKDLPFAKPYLPGYHLIEERFRHIMESGMLTKGRYLEEYEEALRLYLQVPHAVAVSSCTLGLILLTKALGLQGEVIAPSFSFFATFHALVWNGLKPVFADCEPDTFTLSLAAAEKAITPNTSAILATYLFGNPPDIDALSELCARKGLALIFDAAHGFGALYHGKKPGSFGDGEVFSSSATKLLVTGEGGAVTCKSAKTADDIKILREYGNAGDYDCAKAGLNARMTEFQTVLGIEGLRGLENQAEARNRLARRYIERLSGLPGIGFQKIRENCRSSYKDFAVLVDEEAFGLSRDELQKALAAEGIHGKAYFAPPGHQQKVYLEPNFELPVTEKISREVLCLPFYSGMEEADLDKVAEAIDRIRQFKDEIKLHAA